MSLSDETGPPEPQEPAQAPETDGEKLKGGSSGHGFKEGHPFYPRHNHFPGLARMIKRATMDGATLVRYAVAVLEGEKFKRTLPREDGTMVDVEVRPSIQERNDVLKWLGDRGWGKKPEDEGGDEKMPFLVVYQGGKRDPMAEPEPEVQAAEQARPALPLPMPEVGFDLNLNDVEEKP